MIVWFFFQEMFPSVISLAFPNFFSITFSQTEPCESSWLVSRIRLKGAYLSDVHFTVSWLNNPGYYQAKGMGNHFYPELEELHHYLHWVQQLQVYTASAVSQMDSVPQETKLAAVQRICHQIWCAVGLCMLFVGGAAATLAIVFVTALAGVAKLVWVRNNKQWVVHFSRPVRDRT